MKDIKLGNLEELILLLVGLLGEEAYSVMIVEEYRKQTKGSINISAIHTALYRLEDKGFLSSKMSDSNAKRGGKRKRIFSLTSQAVSALNELATLREKLRNQVPSLTLRYNG